MTLGKCLRKIRKEKKLTQAQVAEHLDISVSTYTKYETGVNEPDISMLKKIAKFFGVSIDYLLGASNVTILTSESFPYTLTEDLQELLDLYTSLNPRNQGKLIERGKIILEEQKDQIYSSKKR